MRLFKPTPTGVALAFATAVLWAIPQSSNDAPARTAVGFPTAVSWSTPDAWQVHPGIVLTPVVLWLLPMLLGGLVHRWETWRLPSRLVLAFLAVALASVVLGAAFSWVSWGYLWSLPALDSGVESITWQAVDAFSTGDDGQWTKQPRAALAQHKEAPVDDHECCETGRILRVIRRQENPESLPSVDADELRAIGREVLARLPPETRRPRGDGPSTHQVGVIALGVQLDGRPVAFASFRNGMFSSDTYRWHEAFLNRGPAVEMLSHRRYFGDVAGFEVMSAPVVALVLFGAGSVALTLLLLLGAFVVAVVRDAAQLARERARRREPDGSRPS